MLNANRAPLWWPSVIHRHFLNNFGLAISTLKPEGLNIRETYDPDFFCHNYIHL